MSEETLAVALEPHVTMLTRPTEICPGTRKPYGDWGVYEGSHGGDGDTLPAAMLACLNCCHEPDGSSNGIGAFWKTPSGELLRDFFNRLCVEHLGEELDLGYFTARA